MNTASVAEFDVVIPTVGRPSLDTLLDDLAGAVASSGTSPGRVIVVDDRPQSGAPLIRPAAALENRTVVVRSNGLGPAHARNTGCQLVQAPWVVFLDDDVRLPARWVGDLVDDLRACGCGDAASQGRLLVPLPGDRRPTDWERNVSGLAGARYITADFAVRTDVLRSCSGFDERFRHAYREDTELAIRLLRGGHRIVWGRRHVEHPVRPAPWWISVSKQSGNEDDALLAVLHGRDWRDLVDAPRGDRSRHVTITATAVASLAAAAAGRRFASLALATACIGSVGHLAWRRIGPGPRTWREVAAMSATSAALPFAATYHWSVGRIRWRYAVAKPLPVAPRSPVRTPDHELVP